MINKKSRLFIAGHRGLIGSKIYARYKSEGYENIIVRTHQELDLLDQKKVEKFFKKERPEYVILSAAKVGGIRAHISYPADFIYENLAIQNNVIWFSHLYNVRKLVFLGSSSIYPRDCPQPMKEDNFLSGKIDPTNEAYAIAKIAGIKLCEKIHDQYGKNFISVVPTNVYGPGDNFNPETAAVIPNLILKLTNPSENSVEIWGTGSARREFLYVDDLADAIYFLMENYNEPQFINIGTGEDVSIRELAELLKEITNYKGKFFYNKEKPDGMPRKLVDARCLNSLGWKPKVSLPDGLKRLVDWYLKTRTNLS